MGLREQYWQERNISRTEAIQKPLIEMTGYIKWLESKLTSDNGDYAKLYSKKDILEVLDDAEHLDDAMMYINNGFT